MPESPGPSSYKEEEEEKKIPIKRSLVVSMGESVENRAVSETFLQTKV